MSRLALRIISALVFIALLDPSSSGSEPKSQPTNKLPAQIAEYYKAYNFVSSFSSEYERTQLASYRTLDTIPKTLRSKRLERVYALLKSVNAHEERVDPEIIIDPGSIKKKLTCRKEASNDRTVCIDKPTEPTIELAVIPSGLFQVDTVRKCTTDTLSIEVTSYAMNVETNLRLISQYEKGGDKIPSEDQILKMPGLSPLSVKEIHRWKFVDGNWIKQEPNIVLLEATAALVDPSSAANYCTAPTRKRK